MSMDITTIPEEELRKDLKESYEDIAACKACLKLGILDYSRGRVQDRYDGNQKIVEKIEAELARRAKPAVMVRCQMCGKEQPFPQPPYELPARKCCDFCGAVILLNNSIQPIKEQK